MIAFDAASNSGYNTADASYTFLQVCTGSERALLVGVSMLSVVGSSVSSITYNSVPLSFITAIASGTDLIRAELWGLVDPSTGSNTVEVTLSAALDSVAGAVSLAGVDQTGGATTFEGAAGSTALAAGSSSLTVFPTSDNAWVVDIIAVDDTAITVGSGQTQRVNAAGTLGSGAMSTFGPLTPVGSRTMVWDSVVGTYSTVGVGVKPAIVIAPLTKAYFFRRELHRAEIFE